MVRSKRTTINTMTPKTILLIINIIGGIAVIGSYVWVLTKSGKGAEAFWGNAPTNIRSIYTISMLLSAIGYFAFIYFTLFKLDLATVNLAVLYTAFLGILVASALWMPLTNLYLSSATTVLWVAIRLVLAIVGIASILLAGFFISLHSSQAGTAYWAAVIGSCYFAFHTAILDAIFWPVLFK